MKHNSVLMIAAFLGASSCMTTLPDQKIVFDFETEAASLDISSLDPQKEYTIIYKISENNDFVWKTTSQENYSHYRDEKIKGLRRFMQQGSLQTFRKASGEVVSLNEHPGYHGAFKNAITMVYSLDDLSLLLVYAAASHNTPCALMLLEHDLAHLNARDEQGNTALINASFNGDVVLVRELVARGADAQARNRLGQSAEDLADNNSDHKDAIIALLKSAQ